MPALAEADDAHDPVVAALVVAPEGLGAPEVADTVDAPGRVVHEEDPHQPAPQEAQDHAGPRHREQAAQRLRDEQA